MIDSKEDDECGYGGNQGEEKDFWEDGWELRRGK